MDFVASCGSTLVFVMAARFWYFYSKRVFLRFYWDKATKGTTWAGAVEDDDDEPTIEGRVQLTNMSGVSDQRSPIHSTSTGSRNESTLSHKSGSFTSETSKRQDIAQPESDTSSKTKSRRMSHIFDWLKPSEKEIRDSLCEADRYTAEERLKQLAIASKDVAMEGYLTKRAVSRSEYVKDKWERRYFVLNYRGQISSYKNRQDYREDPTARIQGRPIDLDEYFVAGNGGAVLDDSATVSTTATNSTVLPAFQIHLKPREDDSFRQWLLRCDTEEVLTEWLQAMSLVSPSSFPQRGGDNV
eukprot:gene26087-32617_t